jgi:Cytochrome P450
MEWVWAYKPLFVGSFFLAVVLLLLWLQQDRRLNSMSGPKGFPLIGIGLGLPPRAQHVFREWALEYGEIFKLRIGWYNWVVINSPEAMKEIFDKQVDRISYTS